MNLPPITTELPLSQEFELFQYKKLLPQLSREDLEAFVLEVIRQKYIIDNNFKQVLKSNE